MGLFKDLKDTTDSAARPTGTASPKRPGAPGAGAQPVDLNDPLWAPIQGITLDKYAQLTAAMARQHLGTPYQAEAWLESQGVSPGTWADVNVGWVNRMATNEVVRTRYGVLYAQS